MKPPNEDMQAENLSPATPKTGTRAARQKTLRGVNLVRRILGVVAAILSLSGAQRKRRAPSSLYRRRRRGATLIVTLGILTVLSVMIIGFFVSSRIHSQTGASNQHRATARNQLDEAVFLAMRFVGESMTYPNYTGDFMQEESAAFDAFDNKLNQHRLAPIGLWFTDAYSETNGFDITRVDYQAEDVLTSPTLLDTPDAHVNLITPQVLRQLPSILTNNIAHLLEQGAERPLRSGWHEIDPVPNGNTSLKLLANKSRIAFAVFNCSSLFDANYFASGPTVEKRTPLCFSQPDVTNWLSNVADTCFTNVTDLFDPRDLAQAPFGFLSFDPCPDIYPLHYDCFETSPTLGRHSFDAWAAVDLNTPYSYHQTGNEGRSYIMPYRENASYQKFGINGITNFCLTRDASGNLGSIDLAATPWYNAAAFREYWLDPVTFYLGMLLHEESGESVHRIENFSAFAWAIANQIDADLVPKVSEFPTADNPEPDIYCYSRADYAVKPVPLINKVHVFNIFDGDTGNQHPDAPKDYTYYDIVIPADTTLSNHYAAAIELWYPFAPDEPPPETWCYVGVVTNAQQASTTTNRPWTADELSDLYDWMNAGRTNNLTLMQILFRQWSQGYRERFQYPIPSYYDPPSDPYINRYALTNGIAIYQHANLSWDWRYDFHPLWRTITDDKDLWFTLNMTGHASWLQMLDANSGDTNLTVESLIKGTSIYQAFYPETYTNASGVYVQDAIYTNFYLAWVPLPDGFDPDAFDPENPPPLTTNRFVGVSDNVLAPDPAPPTLAWNNALGRLNTQLISADTAIGNIRFDQADYASRRSLVSLAMDYGDDYLTLIVAESPPRLETGSYFYWREELDIITQTYTNYWVEVVYTNVFWDILSTNAATALEMLTPDGTTAKIASTQVSPVFPPDGTFGNTPDGALFVTFDEAPLRALPWDAKLYEQLDTLFQPLLSMSDLDALERFLLVYPGSDGWDDWADYFLNYFNENLGSINRILRSHTVPGRFGGKRDYNYIQLPGPGDSNEWADSTDARFGDNGDTYGVYWTVYPKMYQCFENHEIVNVQDEEGKETGEAKTNYIWLAIGDTRDGEQCRVWVNPAVAIEGDVRDRHFGNERVGHVYLDGGDEAGVIVDEALLSLDRANLEFLPMWWNATGYCTVPEPRHNAWWHQWERRQTFDMPPADPGDGGDGDDGGGTGDAPPALVSPRDVMRYGVPDDTPDMEYSWAVKELPFIQIGTPFRSIGEIGHVHYPYRSPRVYGEDGALDITASDRDRNARLAYDTATFTTRSGAALLDLFAVAPTNSPKYGLVQANTQMPQTILTLFSDIHIGWTNVLDAETSPTRIPLKESVDMDDMAKFYADAVLTAPFTMGWHTFADMMPGLLSSNIFEGTVSEDLLDLKNALDLARIELDERLRENFHPRHDYMEDIVRGLIDKVSFRQNVYMLIVAAQTLSRSSTPAKPIVLADQRALVTVIRDAWTGRWVIRDWKWLTE
ncbi:MAG: hypothetical protein FWG50_02095 [Kiritimatiellaeota bacterium]|nr:hypothetical protein [Kiritimatiellota bacterium]